MQRIDQRAPDAPLQQTVASLYATVLGLSEQQDAMASQLAQVAAANPFADVVGDPTADVT